MEGTLNWLKGEVVVAPPTFPFKRTRELFINYPMNADVAPMLDHFQHVQGVKISVLGNWYMEGIQTVILTWEAKDWGTKIGRVVLRSSS
jgi:hypothetical protein